MKTIFILLITILFASHNITAQWTKIGAIPTQHIVALALTGDTIFAASDTNLLYKSPDGGITWDSIPVSVNPIHIVSMNVIDSIIYIGTAGQGIFFSSDYGSTWFHSGTGLLAVAGFAKYGNTIYAATLGNGVYIFDPGIQNWIPRNDSLPSYSVNVFTIVNSSSSLLLGPGSNGTFYRFIDSTNSWNEEYYYGFLLPGLQINKLISNSDTIFAVNGNEILRSEDDGLNWTGDTIGSHTGAYRTIYTGINNHYTLTNLFSGGTWIQQRSRLSISGTTWANDEEFLPVGFSYDILEFQNKLFLAKGDGLYTKSLPQGIENAALREDILTLFPNPSRTSAIHISCEYKVLKCTIFSATGQVLYSENILKKEFTVQPQLAKGTYFIHLDLSNNQSIAKQLIID